MQEANKSGNYVLGVRDKYGSWEGNFQRMLFLHCLIF